MGSPPLNNAHTCMASATDACMHISMPHNHFSLVVVYVCVVHSIVSNVNITVILNEHGGKSYPNPCKS